MKCKVWIARDKYGSLYLFNRKPVLSPSGLSFVPSTVSYNSYMNIDASSNPEITFENSPQLIEI